MSVLSKTPDGQQEFESTLIPLGLRIFIPQSVRGWLLDQLPISTRLSGVFEKKRWRLLGDLHGVSFESISKTKNCGRQTVAELKALVDRLQAGGFDSGKTDSGGIAQLIEFIDATIESIPIRERGMFLLRLGATREDSSTLEEIGTKYDITRERVRQIVDKTTKQLHHRLWLAFGDLLKDIVENCTSAVHPFTPQLLSQLMNKRGASCRFPFPFYVRLLGELAPEIPAWPVGQRPGGHIGRSAQISRELKEILRNGLAPRPLSEAFQQLNATEKLRRLKAREFLDALRRDDSLTVDLHMPEQPTVRLTDPGMRDWVRYVLSHSECPLTPEKILERAKVVIGDAFSPPSPFTLANGLRPEDGFYLLDRRAFGLRQHFRLPVSIWRRVRSDFHRLLKKENRPISTTEVFNSETFDWTKLTNLYEIAQILREDSRFIDLGRFLFALAAWGIQEREYVADLIPKVLSQVGRPMTAVEISKELQRFRSAATALPIVLRKIEELRDYGFGYYGLKRWGDASKEFLVSHPRLVSRVISRAEPPLTFGALCRILDIPVEGHFADCLWRTVVSIRRVKRYPETQSPETLLRHSYWSLERALRAVLTEASGALPAYEIQWQLSDHFGSAFSDRSLADIEACLQRSELFVSNVSGEYLLDKHFEVDLPEFAIVRQTCIEILTTSNEIVGCDDLLERIEAEGIEVEHLSPSMLASVLRSDQAFEEVGSRRFRVRQ